MHYPPHKIAFAQVLAALLWLPVRAGNLLGGRRPGGQPRRILVQDGYRLGDLILLSRVFASLKTLFPDASIDLLASPSGCSLVAGAGWFDRCLALEPTWLTPRSLAATLAFYRTSVRTLRKERYDLAIDFQGDPRGCFLLWAAGIKRIESSADFGAWAFCTRSWPTPRGLRHQVLRACFLLERITGTPIDPSQPPLWPAPRSGSRPLTGTTVLLHVGASRAPKRWSAARLTELVQDLGKRGYRVIAVGGSSDSAVVNSLRRTVPSLETVIEPSFVRLEALTSQSSAVVCFDSFMLHAARALGVPTVAVFGPTDPRLYAPLSGDVIVVWNNRPLRAPYREWTHPRPVDATSVAAVTDAIEDVLRTRKEPAAVGLRE